MNLSIYLSILAIGIFPYLFGQESASTPTEQGFGFVENKGQVRNQNQAVNQNVQFIFPSGKGMNVQLRANGFSYDLYQIQQLDSFSKEINRKKGSRNVFVPNLLTKVHRMDVSFLNANLQPQLETQFLLENKLFYQETGEVSQFRKVVYKNIYPHIDVVFTVNVHGHRMKYDFVVHPGGDISQVQLCFKGFSSAEFKQDALTFEHSFGTITETIPGSWFEKSGKNVEVHYRRLQQTEEMLIVGFEMNQPIPQEEAIIIDPEPALKWGTYLGDSSWTVATGVVTTKNGEVYACGTTQSLAAFGSQDAYQSTLINGGADAYLMKFNELGICVWTTYLGGNREDVAMDVAVDTLNNVYVYGTTYSDSLLASSNTLQNQLKGETDVFLAKFKKDGQFQWCTYFGGLGEERAAKVALDFVGNIYLTGTSNNSGNEMITSGVHQLNNNGGADAFVAKLDTAGALQWSSFFGGSGDEEASGISFGDTSVYISGFTASDSLIATDVTHQSMLGGTVDGYLAKWNAVDGTRIWATYFGGQNVDYINSVKAFNEVVCFAGTTYSFDQISSDTSFQLDLLGGCDAFLGRINNVDGTLQWSTYVGGNSDDYGLDVDIELDKEVFLLGTTYSDSSLATDSVQQVVFGGQSDVFISKFFQTGHRQWTTYYGGAGADEASSIDVFGNSSIYVCGITASDSAMVNAIEYSYNDSLKGVQSGFLARFTQYNSTLGTITGPVDNSLIFCEGDTIVLSMYSSSLGTDAVWAWYDGACGSGTLLGFGDSISFVGTQTMEVFVRAESVTNSSNCISAFIIVNPKPQVQITSGDHLCLNSEYVFTSDADSSMHLHWAGPNAFSETGETASIWVNDTLATGIYYLFLTDIYGCKDTAQIDLAVFNQPQILIASTMVSCFGQEDGAIEISVTGLAPFIFDLNGIAGSDAVFTNLSTGNYVIRLSDSLGCTAMDSIFLTEPLKIITNSSVSSDVCVINSGIASLSVDPSYTQYNLMWIPGNGSTLELDGLASGDYTATVQTPNGCTEQVVVTVPVQHGISAEFVSTIDQSCPTVVDGSTEFLVSNATFPLNYTWSSAIGSGSRLSGVAPGIYSVTAVDADGCSITDSIEIKSATQLIWNAIPQTADCGRSNGSVDISIVAGNTPISFAWSNGSVDEGLTAVSSGIYTLNLMDGNGCLFYDTFDLSNTDQLLISVDTSDFEIHLGESVSFSTSSNLDALSPVITWNPYADLSCAACAGPIATPSFTTDYWVYYTLPFGCEAAAQIHVEVLEPCADLFFPSAFSPNNDGLNDTWCIEGSCITKLTVRIFNQWDQIIYESSDLENCWDGTYQGVLVQSNVYHFASTLVLENGTQIHQNGTLQVTQ